MKEKISGIRHLIDPLKPLLVFVHPYKPFTTNAKDSNTSMLFCYLGMNAQSRQSVAAL